MDTKSAAPISTPFPTCGEVFYILVTGLDLPAWSDGFGVRDSQRDKERAKKVSDQLRDWATEASGRCPSRSEFGQFIRDNLSPLPDTVAHALTLTWARVLDEHSSIVRENTTMLGRNETRGWHARQMAPRGLYFLFVLQKLLQRSIRCGGPCLTTPIDEQLSRICCDGSQPHVLLADCYAHYVNQIAAHKFTLDAKTKAAWAAGKERPSFESLGRAFRTSPHLNEIVLNFGFAGLLEKLAKTFRSHVSEDVWPECRDVLLRQAKCLRRINNKLAEESLRTADCGVADFERYLSHRLAEYQKFVATALSQSAAATLDLEVADLLVYRDYDERFARAEIPGGFQAFMPQFDALWKSTKLSMPPSAMAGARTRLHELRRDHRTWCDLLRGPMLAIEARVTLVGNGHTSAEGVRKAWKLYHDAVEHSRYRSGVYCQQTIRESLGLAAMLHRRNVGEGSIKPWIKQVLGFWDLLEMGSDFDHEQESQRIERAESQFTDKLYGELRTRLRETLPALGLLHWNINGLIGFAEGDLLEERQATPVDKRQKKPMLDTCVGREQTPLMEAIDRGQLDLARELVGKGADLNFINSTGDTCITKAFARRDYDLVLEILRRGEEPIRRATLLRVTEKARLSGLEQSISHGRLDILRELVRWKPGRGDTIDLNVERINGVTPLYYAVARLSCLRMTTEEFLRTAPHLVADTKALAPFAAWLVQGTDKAAIVDAVRKHTEKEQNPQGIRDCIDYMIDGLDVSLDAPNTNDHSALTFAVERCMHDIAGKLLASGASPNHRCQGGCTALCFAIRNDDIDMVKLLLEFGGDRRLFVDVAGRPIWALEMSARLRDLIPCHA